MSEKHTRRRALRLGATCAGLALALIVGSDLALGQDANSLVGKGERLFVEQGCYGCHTIGKVGTQGMAADLSHVGAKRDLAYLTKWLRDPASQRPSAHMPKIEMGKAEAETLAAYLSSLR